MAKVLAIKTGEYSDQDWEFVLLQNADEDIQTAKREYDRYYSESYLPLYNEWSKKQPPWAPDGINLPFLMPPPGAWKAWHKENPRPTCLSFAGWLIEHEKAITPTVDEVEEIEVDEE